VLSQTFVYWDKQQSCDSNPVLPNTEMHGRSIFPFLPLFLRFELSLSPPRPRSD